MNIQTTVQLRGLLLTDAMRLVLRNHLELIILVDKHYHHIQQLHTLTEILKGGLSEYYKENHPIMEEIVIYCGKLAEDTIRNHYGRNGKHFYDAHDAMREFFPEEYKAMQERDVNRINEVLSA